MRPRAHLRMLLLLSVTVHTVFAWQAAARPFRPSLHHQHSSRNLLHLSDGTDDDGAVPAFSFVSDSEPPAASSPDIAEVALVDDEEEEIKEVEFSFESERQTVYGDLDGFAPRSRPSDVQEGLEEFSLGSAAGDLADAASIAAIPIEAVGIGLVAIIGLVYVITTLLFT